MFGRIDFKGVFFPFDFCNEQTPCCPSGNSNSASFFFLQPCQTIYQVFHEAVTRLIQYGVLYVAEVRSSVPVSLISSAA